ncbi:efflux RND transporter periplasmic adaptor subunit [Bradyrhizobium sp.]|jgi:RND family efflux transporter MFP subunit|uniref:efflux RND transporter periplasmic adaptor subunit n=1 Tax=Bradyrhizobium sp. TaxID=376 RepID=UPI003D0C2A63
MSSEPSARPGKPRRILFLLGFVAVCAIALAAFGILDRARSKQEVKAWTDEQAIPTVRLVQAEPGPSEHPLLLPGNVAAFNISSLFARASGYVTAWHSDIGAHVKKGDVLLTISAPDLDQQLQQAKAQFVQLQAAVEQAQATADLGQVTNGRTARLVALGWSTLEQGDTDRLTAASRTAALAVAKANVTAQEAEVNRLQELTGFEQIKAPFDGVVTVRNVNIGDLLNAGGTSGRALYQLADIHRMRIFVNVPQAFLGDLKPGVKATLHLPGQQETFEAELSSTSNALEENSRTALIELQADNPDGKLWPGAFTEVQFHIPSDPNTLRIPSTALIFGTNGMRVAAIDANNKVVLKPVRLGRDLGNYVEIQSGLSLTDRLIDNPQESIEAGAVVRLAGTDAKKPTVAAAE